MYPWDPPKVGVSELVLKKLEGKLWNQLYEAVLESIESFYSSLASSTGAPELYLTDESLSQHLLSLLSATSRRSTEHSVISDHGRR